MTLKEFGEMYSDDESKELEVIFQLADEIYNLAQPLDLDSLIKGSSNVIVDLSDREETDSLARKIDEIIVALGDLLVQKDNRSNEINQAIVKLLCEKYNQMKFWDAIVKITNQSVKPYFETKFLRSYTFDKRKSIYVSAMDMAIFKVESEDVVLKKIEILGIVKEQFSIIVKLMNTLVDAAICKGRAYSSWIEYSQHVFYLEVEDSQFIWEIIEGRKQDLYYRTVMRKIQDLEMSILSIEGEIKDLSLHFQ